MSVIPPKEGVDFVTTLRLTAQVHSPITARLFERAADEIERLSSTLSKAVYERDGFVESLIQLGRESAIAVTGDVDVVGAIITPDQAVTAIREECRLGREAAKDLNEESAYAELLRELLAEARTDVSYLDTGNCTTDTIPLIERIDAALTKNPSSGGSSERAGGCTPVSSPGAPAPKREDVGVVASPSLDGVLTERFKLVPIDPTDAMVDAACRDVGLCDGDAKDEELRQEYRVAYRAMVGDAPEAMRHQMNSIVTAQHDETGRLWSGPLDKLPPRYAVTLNDALTTFFKKDYPLIIGMAGIPNSVRDRIPMIAQESFIAGRASVGAHKSIQPEIGNND